MDFAEVEQLKILIFTRVQKMIDQKFNGDNSELSGNPKVAVQQLSTTVDSIQSAVSDTNNQLTDLRKDLEYSKGIIYHVKSVATDPTPVNDISGLKLKLANIESILSSMANRIQALENTHTSLNKTVTDNALQGYERISLLERSVSSVASADLHGMNTKLNKVADKINSLESAATNNVARSASITTPSIPAFDPTHLNDSLSSVLDRLAKLEYTVNKAITLPANPPANVPAVVNSPPFDPTPINNSLETAFRRLSEVEFNVNKLASTTSTVPPVTNTTPTLSAFDPAPINTRLDNLDNQLRNVPGYVQGLINGIPAPVVFDSSSINARLDKIEATIQSLPVQIPQVNSNSQINSNVPVNNLLQQLNPPTNPPTNSFGQLLGGSTLPSQTNTLMGSLFGNQGMPN